MTQLGITGVPLDEPPEVGCVEEVGSEVEVDPDEPVGDEPVGEDPVGDDPEGAAVVSEPWLEGPVPVF